LIAAEHFNQPSALRSRALLSSIDPKSFPETPPSMAVAPLDALTEHVGEPLDHLRTRNDLEVTLGFTTHATVELKHRTEAIKLPTNTSKMTTSDQVTNHPGVL
jgi:hypothetical protein